MCMEQKELLMKIDDLDFYYAQIFQSLLKDTENEIISNYVNYHSYNLLLFYQN